MGGTADEGAKKLKSLLLNDNTSNEKDQENNLDILFKYYEKAGLVEEGASADRSQITEH